MHICTIAPVLLFVVPALVSGAGVGTLGFSLGTKNADGSCKYQADYEADFKAISAASGSKIVRGYAASDCNFAQYILPAAKSQGFKVILGIWPDVEQSFNADTTAITKYAPQFPEQVYAVTVGSETLYRKNFTGAQLADKLLTVRKLLASAPSIKLGTADSWNKYADGTADDFIRLARPDVLLVNAFGFWQGQEIGNATHQYLDDIMQAYTRISSTVSAAKIPKPELWTGETGWPSDGGSDFGAAKAGTKNADTFFKQGVCAMLKWGYNVFYFEAFDEPWKPKSVGDNGVAADETHWGAMTAQRGAKYGLRC